MADIEFTALYPWSLLPDKPCVDRAAARAERDLYAAQFRHVRVTRLPQDCPPWVMGHTLGWTVRSPVSCTMTPIKDTDVGIPDGEEARAVSLRAGGGQMWRRGTDWISVAGGQWMRLYDFRNGAGEWEGMFLPNGQGSAEWRLGVAVTVAEPYFVLVLPLDPPLHGLEVPVGVLRAKTVNAMTGGGGISIAVRPTRPLTVRRGQPVARLLLLHPDTVRATASDIPCPAS
ncbi:hypothetical protein ACF1HU_33185 [Streptomyces olivaceus]|uniref:hypothetical protein n=1 Tax=Streptomyces TaxID=1883 RepID=UPI0004C4E6DB|nr:MULTISPECIES: hypothetical protein [Streptomyces]MBZ6107390.1 hypothetical protein [Streptomyces olivaceus]MCU8595440.1 hypothetical protein [Streptomyces sp. A13(2022)]